MRITELTISGFRCFGPSPVKIDLTNLTVFIGANGTGKSAAIHALMRLFGASNQDRQIRLDDFHVASLTDENPRKIEDREILIEARIEFADETKEFLQENLEDDEDGEDEDNDGDNDEDEQDEAEPPSFRIASFFRPMTIDTPGGVPYCLARLQATCPRNATSDTDIESIVSWVRPSGQVGVDGTSTAMRATERKLIRVTYVPAVRDPARQIRTTSGSVLSRLLSMIQVSEDSKKSVADAYSSINEVLRKEPGIHFVKGGLSSVWSEMNGKGRFGQVEITALDFDPADILRNLGVGFGTSDSEALASLDRLSDGQRSMFFLALFIAEISATQSLTNGDEIDGIDASRSELPPLNVLAVEEPENHVSPHLLGRLMKILQGTSASFASQVVVTSHSPSIMSRVDPVCVRHFSTLSVTSIPASTRVGKLSGPAKVL